MLQVSWIRKSDLHVLTSDGLTFTGDQRFSAHFERPHNTDDDDTGEADGKADVGLWTLQARAKSIDALLFSLINVPLFEGEMMIKTTYELSHGSQF